MSPKRSDAALSNRYELGEQLGAGGMAEVYLGRDRVLGRTVAVKTLLAQYAGDPHFIERFRREAQNAAALNHPNVVSVYDTGSDDGTHYIVMEYVQGRTLRDIVREEGPLLPERAAEIAADVCAGLAFAHAHGIVHRDVKPANIMITPSGAVKVADFGIARAVSGETVTQTAMVLGTAQYFSPEQAQSGPVDARSDIYSLGVVLYEMLTRQVPFTGSSPVAIAYKHVKEAPMHPSRLNPDVPPALESIVMKALAKNPGNRYQSAQEMREDLLRALQGRPVQAEPVLSDATGMIDALSDETMIVERRGMPGGYGGIPTPEQKRRRTGIILLSMIIVAILGVAAWAVLGLVGGPATAKVPDVLGQPQDKAFTRLTEAGFKVNILAPVFSDTYASGTVAVENPGPGTKIDRKKQAVNIAVSKGKETVAVPDVVGKRESEARALITSAGLTVGTISRATSDTVGFGRVISQDPSPRGLANKGGRVDLVISRGKPTTVVPNVVNFFEQDACNRLASEGLQCQVIHEAQNPNCAQDVGKVCRQDPAAGERGVAQGSTVTIWIADPPAEESPTPLPFPTDTATPMPSP